MPSLLLFKFFKYCSYLFLGLVGAELIRGVGLAEQIVGNIIVVFLENGNLAVFNQLLANYTFALDTVKQARNKLNIGYLFHLEGDVVASLKLYAADVICRGIFLYILAQSAEGACSEPGEETP